jgi:hypothetical protein
VEGLIKTQGQSKEFGGNMSKQLLQHNPGEFSIRNMYIPIKPNRVAELGADESIEDERLNDFSWKAKSKRLQARRWRKIKHQLA